MGSWASDGFLVYLEGLMALMVKAAVVDYLVYISDVGKGILEDYLDID